jgi:membrane associated rhomboid family serine protease
MILRKERNVLFIPCLILLHFCFLTNGLRRPLYGKSRYSRSPAWSWSSSSSSPSSINPLLVDLRGGYQNQPIELNPGYNNYAASPPLSAVNEHEAWLREQRQQSELMTGAPDAFRRSIKNESIFTRATRYMNTLQKTSPSIFWTASSCVGIFILWQIPTFRPLLLRLCVCNRSSVVQAAGLPLILAALSHASLYHLLGNMVTLLAIAPGVARDIARPVWPLLLGSAMFSNALWVTLRRSGSCLGLSGVTMSVIAVQARAVPERVYRIFLAGVFPISLPANQILQILLLVSLVGSFVNNSRIAHLTHLGGLLFGVLYYELHVNKARRRYGFSRRHGFSRIRWWT